MMSTNILIEIISIVTTAVLLTWFIGAKLGKMTNRIISGQLNNKIDFNKGLSDLKEYTDGKLVSLEKEVSNIKGHLHINEGDND